MPAILVGNPLIVPISINFVSPFCDAGLVCAHDRAAEPVVVNKEHIQLGSGESACGRIAVFVIV